jgi:3-mercaptopyruvate sulfurtransferase SseA
MLLGALSLVAVVGLPYVARTWSATSSPATPVSTAPQAESSQQAGEIPYPEVPRIPLAEAKAQYDGGTALFVDTRSQEAYESAHISTAISLPLADLEARYGELPQDAEIITY